MKKIDIEIISMPQYVKFECPECEYNIVITYEEFKDMCGSDPYEWEGQTLTCPDCYVDLEIHKYNWD